MPARVTTFFERTSFVETRRHQDSTCVQNAEQNGAGASCYEGLLPRHAHSSSPRRRYAMPDRGTPQRERPHDPRMRGFRDREPVRHVLAIIADRVARLGIELV